jgi:ProP effector
MNEPTTRPAGTPRAARPAPRRPASPPARQHPLLDQLAQWYPALFGEPLKPLKRGIFQDLMDAHGDAIAEADLKAALALHTRSTRYLSVVASGQARHDLAGQPVEDVAPEQLHHALVEVFRRRQTRSPQDLAPQLQQRIARAFEASGLGREAYATLVRGKDDRINTLTEAALDDASARLARESALLRAFEASGQSVAGFADAYGMTVDDAQRMLQRARSRR